VVAVAVLTALVAIAAAANQWASKEMAKADGQARLYLSAWLSYSWRFTTDGWSGRLLGAQFALIGTTLLVTGLLVWCLLRGPVTWGRAFFGSWLAVLFASVVGAIVRGFVAPDYLARRYLDGNRVSLAFFGPYGPSAGIVFAGLVLGLLVAILTSLVAVVSRRSPEPAFPVPPGPPAFADYAPPPSRPAGGPPPWQDQHFGPPAGDQATTRLPETAAERTERPADERPESQPTTQLSPPPAPPSTPSRSGPPPEPGEATQAMPAQPAQPGGEQATTRFPRPPDDEDLGHIEH